MLRDYALIADGERGAVIGPRGDIVWLCAPRWHCDAVFSRLIGSSGLYCEEYDVAQGQLRGNLRQAFVHALMLECAARLAAPWPQP